ncbi:unnamed protein product, partial [Polarella glacialis]
KTNSNDFIAFLQKVRSTVIALVVAVVVVVFVVVVVSSELPSSCGLSWERADESPPKPEGPGAGGVRRPRATWFGCLPLPCHLRARIHRLKPARDQGLSWPVRPRTQDTPSPVLRRAQIVDDAINMDQLRPNEATVRYDMTAVPVEEAVEKADDNLNYLFVFANKEYTPPLTT